MKFLKILKINVLIIIVSFCSTNIFSQKISQEEKLFGLSKLWSEITYNYPYYEYIPFDFDSLYMEYTTKVIQTENDYEYYRLLQRFVCSLHEGHTTVVFPPRGVNKVSQYQFWCWYSYKENKVYIVRNGFYNNGEILNEEKTAADFFENTKSTADKIPIGTEILSVNNIPILDYIDNEIFPYFPVKKEIRYKYLSEQLFWYYMKDSVISVGLKFPNGQMKNYQMKRTSGVCPRWNNGYFAYPRENKMDFFNDSTIFYVHFKDFLTKDFLNEFLSKADTVLRCNGLIIDLRHCIGGHGVEYQLLPIFCKDTIIPYFFERRINNADKRMYGSNNTIRNSTKEKEDNLLMFNNRFYEKYIVYNLEAQYKFNKSIVVLIDESTASAAEPLAYLMQQLTDAVIIGTPTYGSVGSALKVSLPLGGEGHIISSRMLKADNTLFKGCEPDIFFEPTIEDIISGKDATLEKAIEIINKTK